MNINCPGCSIPIMYSDCEYFSSYYCLSCKIIITSQGRNILQIIKNINKYKLNWSFDFPATSIYLDDREIKIVNYRFPYNISEARLEKLLLLL